MAQNKTAQVHQMTIAQFEEQFQTEDDCKSYLANNRWPNVVTCPRCSAEATEHGTHDWHWNCYNCTKDGLSYRFSVTVGTIFENTNKPLRQWFRVMHMMLTSKKGISALQIQRVMGFGSYSTALNMCNKIRVALSGVEFQQLVGVVEVDETFVGGKAKNKHKDKRGYRGGTGGGARVVASVRARPLWLVPYSARATLSPASFPALIAPLWWALYAPAYRTRCR